MPHDRDRSRSRVAPYRKHSFVLEAARDFAGSHSQMGRTCQFEGRSHFQMVRRTGDREAAAREMSAHKRKPNEKRRKGQNRYQTLYWGIHIFHTSSVQRYLDLAIAYACACRPRALALAQQQQRHMHGSARAGLACG
jgi:hypothetical protein